MLITMSEQLGELTDTAIRLERILKNRRQSMAVDSLEYKVLTLAEELLGEVDEVASKAVKSQRDAKLRTAISFCKNHAAVAADIANKVSDVPLDQVKATVDLINAAS